ncbi:Aste57867_499 [Aphanomyces stellatus]|uniref:Aste57867_499 protein n=1 Tax=Aphanomyces stellatus TaxID=120398 RepID=A0A485K6W8_9STRA|nr:hypothetical protein As57867_000498 [Aphanomyces stellatus]VFT77724.1 Aste57867_499 [Aphanomyces stellatus]
MSSWCRYADVPPTAPVLAADSTCGSSRACLTSSSCSVNRTYSESIFGFGNTDVLYLGNLSRFSWDFVSISQVATLNLTFFTAPPIPKDGSAFTLFIKNAGAVDVRTLNQPLGVTNFSVSGTTLLFPSASPWSDRVTDIQLVNANLTALPLSLQTKPLNSLVLDQNMLTTFPPVQANTATFSVAQNKLTALADLDLTRLKRLWLRGNPLQKVTNVTFSTRLAILYVDISDCPLETFTVSPDTFDALNNLLPLPTSSTPAYELYGLNSGFRANRNIQVDAAACRQAGGNVQPLWTNKTQWTFNVCVLSATPVSSDTNSSSSNLVLILGVTAGVFVVAGLAFFYFMRKSASASTQDEAIQPSDADEAATTKPTADDSAKNRPVKLLHPSSSSQESTNDSFLALDVAPLRLHKLELTDLVAHHRLAAGAFGEVWYGLYGSEPVAIKRMKDRRVDTIQKFIDEIVLLSKMDCPYIVRFVGASWRRPIEMECVVEFMDQGDLRSFLAITPIAKYTWAQKIACVSSVVNGLVYLHTFSPPILHRDLKSRNVLLDSIKGVKLTDFGASREMDGSGQLTHGVGTFQWMAPEVIFGTQYTLAADIYSFGMLLSELCSHEIPYANLIDPATGHYLTQQAILLKIEAGELGPSFHKGPAWVQDWGRRCTAHNPADRPTSMQLQMVIHHATQWLEANAGVVGN